MIFKNPKQSSQTEHGQQNILKCLLNEYNVKRLSEVSLHFMLNTVNHIDRKCNDLYNITEAVFTDIFFFTLFLLLIQKSLFNHTHQILS